MKIIQGDLILEKDTTFHESIKVEGNILGKDGNRFSLTVYGDITAWDITAHNIYAENITARDIIAWDIIAWDINAEDITARDINADDITAWDITAEDITARDINADDIICESRKKKNENDKTIARVFIQNKSKLERKNWELEA